MAQSIEENINTEEFIEKLSDGSEQAKDILYMLFKVGGLDTIRILHRFNQEGVIGEKIVARFNHYQTVENLHKCLITMG